MASREEFVKYLCEQIANAGETGYKKMFGEYMAYVNGKPVFLICNDTLYVKISDEVTAFIGGECETGSPYNGAKPHYIIENVDDREFMTELAVIIERITPVPKPKKKKIQ